MVATVLRFIVLNGVLELANRLNEVFDKVVPSALTMAASVNIKVISFYSSHRV